MLSYAVLRSVVPWLNIDEDRLKGFIREGSSRLYGYWFSTRAETLDFMFFSKYYEPETTDFIRRRGGRVFLDIGAHIGRMSVLASRNFDRVCAYEPHPSNFAMLTANFERNRIGNATPLNYALSNSDDRAFMSLLGINTGAAEVAVESGQIGIKRMRLDGSLSSLGLWEDDISLMKIDVENHDVQVLEGAERLLRNGSPAIVIETFNVQAVTDILAKHGFALKRVLDFYNYVFERTV